MSWEKRGLKVMAKMGYVEGRVGGTKTWVEECHGREGNKRYQTAHNEKEQRGENTRPSFGCGGEVRTKTHEVPKNVEVGRRETKTMEKIIRWGEGKSKKMAATTYVEEEVG